MFNVLAKRRAHELRAGSYELVILESAARDEVSDVFVISFRVPEQ